MKTANITDLKFAHIAAGVVLVPLWSWFSYRHVNAFIATGDWAYLFLCISESLTVAFLLIRTYPKSVSAIPFDWLIAIGGTFTTLLFTPETWGILPVAKYAVAVGALLQTLGVLSLNRSFALVPAKREIKTMGMYRFVRHPLYASYLLTFSGYVLANTTAENLVVYSIAMGCMIIRIFREEKHLSLDQTYSAYMQQVRYRVIPFVF
ncbi:MAG: isoprenylcysteine carboxyl methyltransferase [Herminiimonas sp.]|nr:isoprenylcysteine carboxyl methyltransferase [Herminiimonas sp.]